MSDPYSDGPFSDRDVDGVVSRVRRLVGDPNAARDEKFVLTEALRVDGADGDPKPPKPAQHAELEATHLSAADADAALLASGRDVSEDDATTVPQHPSTRDEQAHSATDDRSDDDTLIGAAVAKEVERILAQDRDHSEPESGAASLLGQIIKSPDASEAQHPQHVQAPETLSADALRALVVEIVRAELQGELGERITRNVRKLVRREVHRALISQNID